MISLIMLNVKSLSGIRSVAALVYGSAGLCHLYAPFFRCVEWIQLIDIVY
jgi:hypothetical protein